MGEQAIPYTLYLPFIDNEVKALEIATIVVYWKQI
jgi:hypothetical protein